MDIFVLYYIVAVILMFLLVWKYKRSMFALLLILLAFGGTFDFWIPRGMQMINILTTIIGTYLVFVNKVWRVFRYFRYLVIAFAIFSFYFILVNLLVHINDVLFVFSQYSKYYVPFVSLLLLLHYAHKDILYLRYFNQLIFELLLIQIIISIYKYLLFGGHFWEGMVGTFGVLRGGGAGTSFPLVALCWVALNTNLDFRSWRSWLFIAGLLLLGIAAGKRAVILLFPILFLILSIYICRKKYSYRMWFMIATIPLLFYLGVRLTPSFNKEKKVWGNFDLEYVLDYTKSYSTGRVKEGEVAKGRLGSVAIFWTTFKDTDNYSIKTLFGEGVEHAYTTIEERELYNQFGVSYGLNHRGDITGILMLQIAIGIVGVILFIIYDWFLFRIVKYKRLRWVLLALLMFDFVYYNATMSRDPFVSVLMMYIIVYSLVQHTPKGQYIGNTFPWFLPKQKKENANHLNQQVS